MMDPEALSDRLRVVTAAKFDKYQRLRTGKQACAFWDFIVLTATDADQAESYTKQLETKVANKEIPNVKYYVFPDPKGPKIGNGGATMFALTELERLHSEAVLDNAKVLLIHAGGYSKRLPNVSVTGKIFAALPFGDPVFTMLEMKLASYIDFPEKMAPGVFVTCADDIELLDCEGDLDFRAPGFTALGHPSTLEIGTTHGVFVLDEVAKQDAVKKSNSPCILGGCTRFLHKPSIEKMQDMGAPVAALDNQVYTDSAYYCNRATSKMLQSFYEENYPLQVEIDAYGDFLQALGPESSEEYTRDDKNVISSDDGLAAMRLKLYHYLKDIPLNVILCNVSKFYHIGTIPEYAFHYCADQDFKSEMGCAMEAFVAVRGDAPERAETLSNYCAIHSVLSPDTHIGSNAVVEYSDLGYSVVVGAGSVISNATIEDPCCIPPNTFLHTTITKDGYVTIVYGTKEDLKAGAKHDDIDSKLTFCNVSCGEAFKRMGCDKKDFWDPITMSKKKCTLWNARIFPVFPTERASINYAIRMASAAASGGNDTLQPSIAELPRLDMEGILKSKDLSSILATRDALRLKIVAGRTETPKRLPETATMTDNIITAVLAAGLAISVVVSLNHNSGGRLLSFLFPST